MQGKYAQVWQGKETPEIVVSREETAEEEGRGSLTVGDPGGMSSGDMDRDRPTSLRSHS